VTGEDHCSESTQVPGFMQFCRLDRHEEDNTAWDYLTETREDLRIFQEMNPERDLSDAWKALYIAEGSDWNWWYGDDHNHRESKGL